jgi:UDP-N-acetylglucosamine--N-acetylmuramyl-(pentapeptide) pyrophosphoryl-undecaprenol N-acetylglucosamine transferase
MDYMPARRPILIMSGGTGGHVFPALAVAEELQAGGWPVAWLGTRAGLEARVVPAQGIPIYWIRVRGLRGKGLLSLLTAPFMLSWSTLQAAWVLLKLRPAAVLGMGGYTTGPGGVMAWLLRRTLIIHEQNSVAGLTNRLLRPFAHRVLEAFPGSLAQATHTGNPVRRSIAEIAFSEPAVGARRRHLLVVGGSLGATVFNKQVPLALAGLTQQQRPQVWHQTGSSHIDEAKKAYAEVGVEVRLEGFIEDMSVAYRWADLVLCRAGALTIAELAAAGVASILIPYPYAVDDHQTANARYLVDAGAAVLMPQSQMTAERLRQQLSLLQEPERLISMAKCARKQAMPDAAKRVADICVAAAHGQEAA